MTTNTHSDELRAWAKGSYPLEAAVQLILRAFGGRFADPGNLWIEDADGDRPWLNAAAMTDDKMGVLSGGEAAVDPLINHFTTLIPERMPEGPDRWKLMAEHLSIPTLLRTLRDDAISGDDRKAALTALAEAADEVTGETGKWGPKHNW